MTASIKKYISFSFKILVLFFTLALIFTSLIYQKPTEYLDDFIIEQGIAEPSCKFPKLDPWDESIMQYVYHPPILWCNKSQPYLTLINYKGQLLINETELEILKLDNITDITCSYRTFKRGKSDASNQFSSSELLKKPVFLEADMVEVTCTAKNDSGYEIPNFYYNLHAHPSVKAERKFEKPTENQLSVLLFTIDSISYSMFQRNMPQTFEYVTKQMGMIMFESKTEKQNNKC